MRDAVKQAMDNPEKWLADREADRERRRETAWLILALLSLLGIWFITS